MYRDIYRYMSRCDDTLASRRRHLTICHRERANNVVLCAMQIYHASLNASNLLTHFSLKDFGAAEHAGTMVVVYPSSLPPSNRFIDILCVHAVIIFMKRTRSPLKDQSFVKKT